MTMFIIGLFVGMAAFALIASVVIFNKLQLEVAAMHRMMQVMALKINKIEKTTDATMNAAENFVDALRSSAEQMMVMRPGPLKGNMPPGGFDDIRKSFEEGIRRFEENEMNDSDDEEDSEGEGEEPWKK
jgi:hypothetical protein